MSVSWLIELSPIESKRVIMGHNMSKVSRDRLARHFNDQLKSIILLSIVIIGILRASTLLFHTPIYGYGSQSDPIRTQKFFGYFPKNEEGELLKWAHPEGPKQTYYKTKEIDRQDVFLSTELMWTGVYTGVHTLLEKFLLTERDSFDIRSKSGLVFGLSSILIAYWLLRLSRVSYKLAILFASCYTIFWCDPVNTLWANTFYQDFAAWTSFVVFFIGVCLLLADDLRWRDAIVLALAAFGVAMSKVQHSALPIALIAFFILIHALHRKSYVKILPALCAALIGLMIQVSSFSSQTPGRLASRQAHIINAVFATFLPYASDKEAALKTLRLGGECRENIGRDYWNQKANCPEVHTVSRLDLLQLSLSQPLILYRLFESGTRYSANLIIHSVGHFEGETRYDLSKAPWYLASYSQFHQKFGLATLLCMHALIIAIPICFCLGWGMTRKNHPSPVFILALGCIAYEYVFWSTAFGEGVEVDFARHVILGSSIQYSLLAGLSAWLFVKYSLSPRFLECSPPDSYRV